MRMHASPCPLACARLGRGPARSRGFTLTEIMIVVAIVGILAAIAYPSYQQYVLKGRRAEARAALAILMQQQEKYATQYNTYLAFSAGASGIAFKTYTGDSSSSTNANYLLSAAACTDQTITDCVLLSAIPQQTDTVAGTLTLDSMGTKSCTGTDTTVCWK